MTELASREKVAWELIGLRLGPDRDQVRGETLRLVADRYLHMADVILDAAEMNANKAQLEMRLQEILLSYGWRNPLGDAARLVDGLLYQEAS